MPSRLFRFQLEDLERRQMLAFGATIDPTFGSFGVAEAAIPGRLAMVAEVAGGKVLGVGTELADPPTHLVVFRWTPNGTPDETFGTHGQITSIGVETVDAAAVQPDGKIVVVGLQNSQLFVARFTSGGALDNSFAGDGVAELPFGASQGSVVIAPAGQIVLPDGIRLTSAGVLDNSFDSDGVATLPPGFIAGSRPAVMSDGRVLLGGYLNNQAAVARLTVAGALDPSFDGDGIMSLASAIGTQVSSSFVQSIAIAPGDKIALAGNIEPELMGFNSFFIARLNANGTLDDTFAGDGVTTGGTDVLGSRDVKVDAAGRIVFLDTALHRFKVDGTQDQTFGPNGIAPLGVGIWAMANEADGNFLVAQQKAFFVANQTGHTVSGAYRVSRVIVARPDVELGSNGVLLVTGTDAKDVIMLESAAGGELHLTRNGKVSTFAAADVTRLDLELGAGDDLAVVSVAIPARISGGDGNDRISTGAGNDTVSGNAGKDAIDGGDGDDRINGNGSHDRLSGLLGADRIYGGTGMDIIAGGAGVDRIFGQEDSDRLFGGSSNDKIYGEGGNDRIYGENQNDYLDGGPGNNLILGGDGDDTLVAGGGMDTFDGGLGRDSMLTAGGSDTIYALDGEIDFLDGGSGSNTASVDSSPAVKDAVLNINKFI